MLLTITTTHQPATDLGYLLHKHPDRFQSFSLNFGKAHVFYSESSAERSTAALLLEVDPVSMVRGKHPDQGGPLQQYVNDRPYVASSFFSVALSHVFRSAMAGICKERELLSQTPIPLSAKLALLPVRGGETWLRNAFEPLGYQIELVSYPLDEQYPDWGDSPYFTVTLNATITLSQLLRHLYILIPAFDGIKHYFVGDDELEKLMSKGEGWLAQHPFKEQIARRYLPHRPSLHREALARLADDETLSESDDDSKSAPQAEPREERISLNEQRLGAVMAALRHSGARRVLDLGCGEGKLIRELLSDRQFEQIVGMDVSVRSLEIAGRRLRYDRLPDHLANRLKLMQGSLSYRDGRLQGFDAAAIVEVIEHLDPPRLTAFERVVFEFARPKTVVLTTPNCEYNVKWESLPAGQFRHSDHRFEWTRDEFQSWALRTANQHRYSVRFLPVGDNDPLLGAPTQMAIFEQTI